MKTGFNGASTMKTDLPGDIRAASAAGYDLIEIWAKKMEAYLLDHDIGELRGLLEQAGVMPLAINSVEFVTFNAPWEKANTMNLIGRYAALADQLGCPYIVLVPSPRPDGISDREVFDESVRVLGEIAERFGGQRVKFAFEFLGFPWCSVTTLEEDYRIVKAVGRENVGLVFDTFHFYAGGSFLDGIRYLEPGKIFIVHINDCEERPKAQLQDAHRLFPGEGVIPLNEIVANLKGTGYDGPVSLEMFRPAYWLLPPEEVAEKGMAAIRRYF